MNETSPEKHIFTIKIDKRKRMQYPKYVTDLFSLKGGDAITFEITKVNGVEV
jgi:hypothetical protein